MPCSQGLYFPQQDKAIEAGHIPGAELRRHDSRWGHRVASPGKDAGFEAALDANIRELLA